MDLHIKFLPYFSLCHFCYFDVQLFQFIAAFQMDGKYLLQYPAIHLRSNKPSYASRFRPHFALSQFSHLISVNLDGRQWDGMTPSLSPKWQSWLMAYCKLCTHGGLFAFHITYSHHKLLLLYRKNPTQTHTQKILQCQRLTHHQHTSAECQLKNGKMRMIKPNKIASAENVPPPLPPLSVAPVRGFPPKLLLIANYIFFSSNRHSVYSLCIALSLHSLCLSEQRLHKLFHPDTNDLTHLTPAIENLWLNMFSHRSLNMNAALRRKSKWWGI